MSDDTRDDTNALDEAYDAYRRRPSDPRLDALIGEVVRILINADKAAFTKIYATAKAEATAQADRAQADLNLLRRRLDSPPKEPPLNEQLSTLNEQISTIADQISDNNETLRAINRDATAATSDARTLDRQLEE